MAPAGGNNFYYLVGTVTDSCSNQVNRVVDVEWGCQVQPPPGGIAATSLGVTTQDDALMSTLSLANDLEVEVFLEGANTSQPMGTKGTVRIEIRNFSGGTIKGGARASGCATCCRPNTSSTRPTCRRPRWRRPTAPLRRHARHGRVDQPGAGHGPAHDHDPAVPLRNTSPEFLVTSSTVHSDFHDQFNMIRHGDILTIRFGTVLIDPQYYDLEAYVDLRQERPGSNPAGTDPTETFPITNQLEIWWEEFCTNTEHYRQSTPTTRPSPRTSTSTSAATRSTSS